jgi:hypothetical protein
MENLKIERSPTSIVKNTVLKDTIWLDTSFDFGLTLCPVSPIINNKYQLHVQPFTIIKLQPKGIIVGELTTDTKFRFIAEMNEEAAIKTFYELILTCIQEFNMEMWKNGIPQKVYYNGAIEFKDLYMKIKTAYFANTIQ